MDIIIHLKDKILVVAPHADDESLGCGGLLALYGKQCDLMLVTDGRHGHTKKEYENEKELVKIRNSEFKNAAKIAGVNEIIFLDIEDGKILQNRKNVYRKDIRKYDYIFVPNRNESHADHKVLFHIFRNMKIRQRAKCQIMEYEVWTPISHPTWFLDITSVSEEKKEMISQYISQIADIDYVSKGMALSCYRGAFIDTKFAEAYMHSEYSGIKKSLYHLLPNVIKEIIKRMMRCRNNE